MENNQIIKQKSRSVILVNVYSRKKKIYETQEDKSLPTLARASLAASASAAMARINCSGTRTSFTFQGASLLSQATISKGLSEFQVDRLNFKYIVTISSGSSQFR